MFSNHSKKQQALTQGANAEDFALAYLRNQGLELIDRNYRCRGGEIDLIMIDGDTLVFVEVKYRKSSSYGSAAEMVSVTKQRKILHCAEFFLVKNSRFTNSICRFDVFAIEGSTKITDAKSNISWIKSAFFS